ncbi:hypothetical protein JW933_03915 [candidate division FCPU426 bacterium]|nr:hypothetical protein [candidate division FCPU426 bacterium]
MRALSFLAVILAAVFFSCPAVAEEGRHWQGIRCACVGSKVPAHKDDAVLRAFYPGSHRVQRLLFAERTYYVMVKNRKIDVILSGWQTEDGSLTIWLAMDQKSQLHEVIYQPAGERRDVRAQAIYITRALTPIAEEYGEAVMLLCQDLASRWPEFIRRINLHIHQLDTITQATP